MNFLKKNREILILLVIYFIANIFLLLNINGIYWDDWTLVGNSYESISSQFYQNSGASGIIISTIHDVLLHMGNGVFSYRLLTFILYFLTTIFLFLILKNVKQLNKIDVFFITLIFMIAPLNSAKIALIDLPYTLFLTMFFLGFYLLAIYIKNKNILLRIIILLVFFSSFLINSFLVFYAIPLAYIYYQNYYKGKKKLNIKKYIYQNFDFILLPILFFIIKSIYFQPSGLYAGYNSLGLDNLVKIVIGIPISFYSSFIVPINQSFELFSYFWILIIFYFLFVKFKKYEVELNNYDFRFLFIGVLFFVLAVFPYLAVGKLPQLSGFESRHQLLIPLGFSFIIYFSIKILINKFSLSSYTQTAILNIFIFAFISQNIYNGYRYKLDWIYQVAIEEQMKDFTVIQKNTTFIVDAHLLDSVLANNRKISFYEHNGRLKKAFGNDSRLMVNVIEDIDRVKNYKPYKQYNFSKWKYEKPIYVQIIKKDTTLIDYIKIFIYEFINKNKFEDNVKILVDIRKIQNVE